VGNIVNKRHAPKYLAEIWDLLTELSTSAGGTFFGAECADQQQRPRQDIAQPCCCVHATTVPEPFWAALQEGSMVDGSLAHFLVFQTDEDVPDRNKRPNPASDVPAKLIEALRAIVAGATRPRSSPRCGRSASTRPTITRPTRSPCSTGALKTGGRL
jgi:hypothetical protein